ncbi:MAG: DivIVA domain-containing protein [candidate division WOR-3 bacterium]|jgi:cell division initiation protein
MALTPLEIRKKSFNTAFRGYAPKEVRAFLAVVANEFEELRKERVALAEKVDELSARVAAYEKTEDLLKETLLTAQQVAEQLKSSAEREREIMIQQIKQEAEQLRTDLDELRSRRALLLDEIRGIANTYLAIVERFEKEKHARVKAEDSGERSGNKK